MSRRVDTVTVVGGLQFSQGGQPLAAYCVRSTFRCNPWSVTLAALGVRARSAALKVPLLNGLVVFDQWKRVVEMVEECAPFLVLLGLSESDRVVV